MHFPASTCGTFFLDDLAFRNVPLLPNSDGERADVE
jgi:hypothetical protein